MILKQLSLGALDTNCYFLADEQTHTVAVIDPAADAPKILATLQENGWTAKYIIITHAHIDHIAALDDVAKATGAKVVLHNADRNILNNDALCLALYFGLPAPKVPADILVNDGDTLSIGNLTLTFIHTPGHNPGSMCILVDDTLIAGDTLFYESVGRVDHYGGDYQTILRSLNRLMELDDAVKVYPGHGPATTIGHERMHNPYIRS